VSFLHSDSPPDKADVMNRPQCRYAQPVRRWSSFTSLCNNICNHDQPALQTQPNLARVSVSIGHRATKTRKALTVKCELDTNKYPKEIKVSDEELRQVNIVRDEHHGKWNYAIQPKSA